MISDAELELFKKCFIDNESSPENLLKVREALFEFREAVTEQILADYINKRLNFLYKNISSVGFLKGGKI